MVTKKKKWLLAKLTRTQIPNDEDISNGKTDKSDYKNKNQIKNSKMRDKLE